MRDPVDVLRGGASTKIGRGREVHAWQTLSGAVAELPFVNGGRPVETPAVFFSAFRLRHSKFHARPANSRVSVCTLTFSPSLMKSGTRISRPVLVFATLVTLPLVVSPRTPGSVD